MVEILLQVLQRFKMTIAVVDLNNIYKDDFVNTPIESFNRMFTTAYGTRIMLPHFGSSLYTLVDKNFSQEWLIDFKRFSLECCFDENGKLWDKRVYPKALNIKNINTATNEFYLEFEIEFFTGEHYSVRLS